VVYENHSFDFKLIPSFFFALSAIVAAHTVLKIADAFLQVLRLNARRIMLVAAVTSILLEVRRRVARLARDVAAFAMIQREDMIERRALPGLCGVALRAVRAESAQVLLRLRMATGARLRCAFEDAIGVTLLTWHTDVRARQLERRQIVIECRVLPSRRSVALRAVRPERALMLIVLLMAGHTSLRRALEDIVDVALRALDRLVLAHEFECGQCVIELCALPTVRGMALGAIDAEDAIVSVVFPVAIDALG
jgi:hypothetical protein